MGKLRTNYPSFILVAGYVDIQIGFSCLGWRLKEGERVRFHKHGTFVVERLDKSMAVIRISVPRKGWNPTGLKQHTVILPARARMTVCQGEIAIEQLSDGDWKVAEASAKSRIEYIEHIYRRLGSQVGQRFV